MASSKFFTNHITNTLFDKFKGIIDGMSGLHGFHAVVGYFRSSGYFKIRSEFEKGGNAPKIQILIGINIDNIFRKHNKSMLFLAGEKVSDEAYELYRQDFIEDVKNAGYYEDVEKGILMLADDLQAGRVELKIHPTRDLHAKFYLFLPEKHTPHSDGWVIMGSSNLSESGLGLTQPPKYELNVAMKDYDDVAFCKSEFDTLWKEGLPLTFEDIERYTKQTHIGQNPTPYELYIKLLVDYFGDQIEDDFSLEIPEGFKELQDKGIELDDIIEKGVEKFGISKEDFVYPASAFNEGFLEDLKYDIATLDDLIAKWEKVVDDPKLDRFIEYLNEKIFDKQENPTGKVVVFSESKDTINYLETKLTRRLGRKDILSVSSDDRKKLFDTIQANFDANYHGKKKDDYNIIILTDVLAEGVNLHRSNVIVNYDTPWNATRLMQRIGRVNRIGSVAGTIVNYLFYPSAEGDAQIKLYKDALAKLQGFHSAYGEDLQIYSKEEIVEQFELFKTNIGKKIKPNSSLVYIASSYKKEFYKVEGGEICDMGFMEVIELFEAEQEEKAVMLSTCHYQHVSKAHSLFDEQVTKMMDDSTTSTPSEKDNTTDAAKSLLRKIWRECPNTKTREQCDILTKYVELGTFPKLTRDLARLERKYKKRELTTIDIETAIKGFMARYHKKRQTKVTVEEEITPQIILSETFV